LKKINRKKKNIGIILFFSILFLILWIAPGISDEEEKISIPGKYAGYSGEIYKEWVRTSEYVTVRDGTKLAVDIYRPAKDGKPVSEQRAAPIDLDKKQPCLRCIEDLFILSFLFTLFMFYPLKAYF